MQKPFKRKFFQLHNCCCPKHQLVHRTSSENFSQCCLLSQESQKVESLMAWGCITENGPGPLVFIDETMKYISILNNTLPPFLEMIPLAKGYKLVFQQDNAPPHKAQNTITALRMLDLIGLLLAET